MVKRQYRVLVVEGSAPMSILMARLLATDPELHVVGTAADAWEAREKIKQLEPDVLTLDVALPGMSGLAFLRNLMRLHPMPVVVISDQIWEGSEYAAAAAELGALNFMARWPSTYLRGDSIFSQELKAKVKAAASHGVNRSEAAPRERRQAAPPGVRRGAMPPNGPVWLIAIGASTGGVEAIRTIFEGLPADCPPVVVAQHILPNFNRNFVRRMNAMMTVEVTEATDGMDLRSGLCVVSPGDRHLRVDRIGNRLVCRLDAGPRVNNHRPSVDVLFDSVADSCAKQAIGIILTGMGHDGARGLRRLHDRGARTIAQDEASSVIWGMPKAAIDTGAVDQVLPLDAMAAAACAEPPPDARTGTRTTAASSSDRSAG